MNQDIEQLKRDVEELKRWKEEKIRQQISYPLDIDSQDILGRYFLRIIGSRQYYGGVAGRLWTDYIAAQANDQVIVGQWTGKRFTVDTSTDYLITSSGSFLTGSSVMVSSSDTLPGGLSDGTTYYIINSTGLTFQLSTTPGGAAVNITSAGTGEHYVDYI